MDLNIPLKSGLRGEKTEAVTDKNTARAWGSGYLEVYATPAMIALMEMSCMAALEGQLPAGVSTVGTELNIRHVSATPAGMQVRAESELTEVDGRRLVFTVTAYDEAGTIGEGTHSRFIIDNARFAQKAAEKKHSR
jgi:predicted thioesterase